MKQFKNLDQCEAFKELQTLPIPLLKEESNPERVQSYQVDVAKDLTYNYAAKKTNEGILTSLQKLSEEQELIEQYRLLLNGEIMNTGEGRMVLHHLARGRLGGEVVREGSNLEGFYQKEKDRFSAFADKVHAGKVLGSTGKPFSTVVQIGIGGSDLGPRALYLALKKWASSQVNGQKMEARFISNVDPDDANSVLDDVDFAATLFIVVSKSGTTQETLANRSFVLEKMKHKAPELDPAKHMVGVTSETSPMAESPDYLDSFYMDDFIGGRYSSSSAVGGVVLSLAFGPAVFNELLRGAHDTDSRSLSADIRENAPLLDALIGVYERNILGMSATAILPYSQALSRFPAHLQQLDMESNGKQVNRYGGPISYETGPIIFGEPGTNGQHSFYQLLHQGTTVVPLQFIGFREAQSNFDVIFEGSDSQKKLKANLAAQITAFALGQEDRQPNKSFPGERPSSLIYGNQLNPYTLGALLAHYENKVMFQGFLWNLNSFDQEGVQLGKVLTKQILKGNGVDPVLSAYSELLAL